MKVQYAFLLKIKVQIFHHKKWLWSIYYGENTVAAAVVVIAAVVGATAI